MKHLLLLLLPLLVSCSNIQTKSDLDQYGQWASGLNQRNYQSTPGSIYLFVNSDCQSFIDVFGTCFDNNATAPYIIPQLPVGSTYLDPNYATPDKCAPCNSTNQFGQQTNISNRLGDTDALVTVVKFPPKAAYFGYQSYVFTALKSNYNTNIPKLRLPSPNKDRWEIFGSVGNDVNDTVVKNQMGEAWGSAVVVYISTVNSALANSIKQDAVDQGIPGDSIFIEPIGDNVKNGTDSNSDDLITLIRYAVPEDADQGQAWLQDVDKNILVYRVTANDSTVTRYVKNEYTRRSGNFELHLEEPLNELAGILQSWFVTQGQVNASIDVMGRTTVDIDGVPRGLIGGDCIEKGTICAGDNADTSTYAHSSKFQLSTQPAFVAGVNHNRLKNSSYVSLSVYNIDQGQGVASSSQTNADAVGFKSGVLDDSAEAVLRELGLYNKASNELKLLLPKMYISLVSRQCNIAKQYCIDLQGTSLIPADANINVDERSYINPGTTTGANSNTMVYPRIILATEFDSK